MMRNTDYFAPTAVHLQGGRYPPVHDRFEAPHTKQHSSPAAIYNDIYGDTDSEGTPCPEYCFSEHAFHRFENKAFPAHNGVRAPPADSFDQHQISHHVRQEFKCRQLPCRTFVSTGSCPYGERCVFLHDPSIVAKPVFVKIKRKSKDDTSTDAFFWPTMSLDSVMGKVDNKNMPHIAQPYVVPAPCNNYYQINSNNDNAVFSMWEHYLDFCKADALSIVTVPRKVPPLNAHNLVNPYTGKRRLSVFARLSQNKPIF